MIHEAEIVERITTALPRLLDPDRELPPLLTAAHLHTVTTTDLTRPELWAALACRGR